MPDNILDQVNFLVGADLGPYRSALRQAEADAQATGAKIKAALGGSGASGGGSSKSLLDIEDGAGKAKRALEDLGGGATRAMTSTHGATSTAVREFRALFDELSSGRTRMVPGTLAIIATRVFGIGPAALLTAAAIGAIPIAFAVAAVQAENALSRIQRALALTGYASGVTTSQIRDMASRISANGIQSQVGAQAGLSILAGRGNVGAAQLPGAEQAASGLAVLSGQKLDKAAEELEKALAQPVEGAKTLNEQMKLLSGAQTREVEDLVASGEKEKAQQIIIDALNARTADATSALGGFARALADFGKGFQNFWNGFGGAIDPSSLPPQQRLAANLKEQAAKAGALGTDVDDPRIAAQMMGLKAQEIILRGAIEGQAVQAKIGQQDAAASQAVNDARAMYRTKISKNALAAEEEGSARIALKNAIAGSTYELNKALAAGDRGAASAAREDLSRFTGQLAHIGDPKWGWGTRGPKGPKPGVVDATSDQTVANAIKDELEGYLKLNQSLEARFAIQQAVNAIEDRAKDAALRKELAEKRITGAAAQQAVDAERRAQLLRNQADAQDYAWKLQDEQGKIDDEMTGFQVATLNAHERMATVGSDRLKIQLQLYDIETKQLQDAQAKEILRNPNIDLNTALGMAGGLAASRGAGRVALAGQPQTAADVQTQNLRETNTQLRLEIGLKYADAELRAKELADLQAAMQLKQEGWAIDDAGYANALAQRRTLLEANAQLNLTLQGQTKGAQTLGTIRQGLDNIAMAGLGGFTSLKQAASDFLLTLARMALQLYIMQPLLNGLFGTSGQPGGGLFGQILGALGIAPSAGSVGSTFNAIGGSFGGGHAAGGYTDPSKFYVVGENGPELFRPGGAGGNVIPLTAPRSSQVASGGYAAGGDINHNISIQVSGNSDQQLMERVHLAASQAVSQGIKAYDHVQGRTQRARFIQSNRRALS